MRLALGLASSLCGESGAQRPEPRGEPVIDELLVLGDEMELRPTLVTGYDRTALVGSDSDPGLRITFDRSCYYRNGEPSLEAEGSDGLLLPPGWVIVEVKVNDRLPSWLAGLIATHQLALTRISKYVQGVERAALAPRSVFFHNTERPLARSLATYEGTNR